jgi:protein TonB
MRVYKNTTPAATHAICKMKYFRLMVSCCIVLLSFAAHGQTVVAAPDTADIERIFTKVEKEARFPGGIAAWQQYLERNLDARAPVKDNAKPGRYNVKVQFIVSTTGEISNVRAIEAPADCPSCLASAIKVVQKSRRWQPAMQSGRAVIYQAVQVFTFVR